MPDPLRPVPFEPNGISQPLQLPRHHREHELEQSEPESMGRSNGHIISSGGVLKGFPNLVQMVDAVPALFHVVGAFDEFSVCEFDDCFESPEFRVKCEFSKR